MSLGGASLVSAGQPADKAPNENANWHATDNAQAPAAAPAPAPAPTQDTKTNRGQAKKHSTPQPTTAAPQTTGGGSHSTATSGPGNSAQGCDGSHNSNTGHGANHSGPYDNTCDGSPSGNGNGNGKATGKPCAGCVGNADDKNPKGQYPNGSDHNAGYECDRNHGIGRSNPAHTGCTSTETTPPASTPPAGDDKGNGSQGCPGATPLANALKHSAALALKAVALAHPGLAKLAKLAEAADVPACTHTNNGNGHTPVTICHATGSATNPYVEITIDENGLNGHGDHQDDRDIIPAPAEGCPAGSTTAVTPPAKTEEQPPGGSTTTPPTGTVPPVTTPLGTTESGQPLTPEQLVLGLRQTAPASTTAPAGTTAPASGTAPQSAVLGEIANGTTPAAASAPAAAQAPRAATSANARGSLPFTGTDALLVLFLGCLVLLGGVAIQRLTARSSN